MPTLGRIAYAALLERVGPEQVGSLLAPDEPGPSLTDTRQRDAMAMLDSALGMEHA
jgi:hypothetical protein